MSKNKSKINKTEKTLRTVINRILNYSALYLPAIENPDLYKIPDPVIDFYKYQFDNDELDKTSIEIVYTYSGELFGYYHIDNDRQITFIIFRSKEDPSKQVFALKNICDNLSNEKDYNIVIRGILLPNHVFYDNYISKELLDKYKGYKCDVCFYSKFDSYRGNLLIDNKLVHYYERPFIIKCLDKCEYPHDLFFDLRKYDKIIDSEEFKMSIYNKYLDIFTTSSFFKDKKPVRNNGKNNVFATDVVTESYYGYNKICFILPSVDNKIIKSFLNNTFIKIIKELNIDNLLFLDRIRFYKSINVEGENSNEIYDDNIHFVENDKIRSSTRFIEYSNEDMINLFLKTS